MKKTHSYTIPNLDRPLYLLELESKKKIEVQNALIDEKLSITFKLGTPIIDPYDLKITNLPLVPCLFQDVEESLQYYAKILKSLCNSEVLKGSQLTASFKNTMADTWTAYAVYYFGENRYVVLS